MRMMTMLNDSPLRMPSGRDMGDLGELIVEDEILRIATTIPMGRWGDRIYNYTYLCYVDKDVFEDLDIVKKPTFHVPLMDVFGDVIGSLRRDVHQLPMIVGYEEPPYLSVHIRDERGENLTGLYPSYPVEMYNIGVVYDDFMEPLHIRIALQQSTFETTVGVLRIKPYEGGGEYE